MGPLLFSLVINGLSSRSLHGTLTLYAHGACIVYSARDIPAIMSWLRDDLHVLNSWHLSCDFVNFEKTVHMLFSKLPIVEPFQPIVDNNTLLQRLSPYKLSNPIVR